MAFDTCGWYVYGSHACESKLLSAPALQVLKAIADRIPKQSTISRLSVSRIIVTFAEMQGWKRLKSGIFLKKKLRQLRSMGFCNINRDDTGFQGQYSVL